MCKYLDRNKFRINYLKHQFCIFLKQNYQLLLVTTDLKKKVLLGHKGTCRKAHFLSCFEYCSGLRLKGKVLHT